MKCYNEPGKRKVIPKRILKLNLSNENNRNTQEWKLDKGTREGEKGEGEKGEKGEGSNKSFCSVMGTKALQCRYSSPWQGLDFPLLSEPMTSSIDLLAGADDLDVPKNKDAESTEKFMEEFHVCWNSLNS